MALWFCLSVCSFAIETTFPLSNFKTKGPPKRGAQGTRNLGHRRRPTRSPNYKIKWGACGAPNGFKCFRGVMRIPNTCLLLKLDTGKVVSIANEQTDRITEPSSTVLVYRLLLLIKWLFIEDKLENDRNSKKKLILNTFCLIEKLQFWIPNVCRYWTMTCIMDFSWIHCMMDFSSTEQDSME